MWYMIRNLRCTVTIDSVLTNSKTQNAFLFTVNAIFLHDYPLAVEPGSTPRPLVQKKLGEILYLLICSFLPRLSWLLRSRVRKSRRDFMLFCHFLYTVCIAHSYILFSKNVASSFEYVYIAFFSLNIFIKYVGLFFKYMVIKFLI